MSKCVWKVGGVIFSLKLASESKPHTGANVFSNSIVHFKRCLIRFMASPALSQNYLWLIISLDERWMDLKPWWDSNLLDQHFACSTVFFPWLVCQHGCCAMKSHSKLPALSCWTSWIKLSALSHIQKYQQFFCHWKCQPLFSLCSLLAFNLVFPFFPFLLSLVLFFSVITSFWLSLFTLLPLCAFWYLPHSTFFHLTHSPSHVWQGWRC